MYQNNANIPNWNSNVSNMNQGSQPIPPNYPYPYASGMQVVNAQQMGQYGLPNMPNPQNNQNGIRGRVISDISQVVPNEVPMDGSVSLFPSQDYSCIYGKYWASDGTIKTIKFVRTVETQAVQDEKVVNPVDTLRTEMMERLDIIENGIRGLTKDIYSLQPQTSTKKTTTARKEAE